MVCLAVLFLVSFFPLNNCLSTHQCDKSKACNKIQPGKLNIHLIPHTHDDAGWLKTVDQYYYGSSKKHAPYGVKHIIDSVISELERDEARRFIYAESSFLWRWWTDQNQESKYRLKKLVEEGRFQIVHGGWVISDEAVTHYSALIDQMDLGLKFINETFGECARPDVAWQIDAFGHSSEVGQEFIDMGYHSLFVGRIDLQDLFNRKKDGTMEMVWRPYAQQGEEGELFTNVLYNLYMPPDGFCFDVFCNDEPIMDNPKRHGYNIEKVDIFIYFAKLWARSYSTENVLIPMGGDFNYMVAGSWFDNMDKLIGYGNERHPEVNILYSTPGCYLEALKSANQTLSLKDDEDFFPYSSYDGLYWSGYYTSRPALKYMTYRVNNLLQVAKKVVATMGNYVDKELFIIEQAVALLQHHDAVTGTAKQHVANDYAVYLQEAYDAGELIISIAYRKWLGRSYPEQTMCILANISECHVSQTEDKFFVNLYNPTSHRVTVPVKLPVAFADYDVTTSTGPVESELFTLPIPMWTLPGRKNTTRYELTFIGQNIPPLGFKTYFIEKKYNSTVRCPACTDDTVRSPNHIIVSNGQELQVVLNGTSGMLMYVVLNGVTWSLEQNFLSYTADWSKPGLKGGAYIFSPSNESPKPISEKATFHVYRGKLMTEIHQTFDSSVSQVIRLHKGSTRIEFDWLVGPIEMPPMRASMEIVTRYKTNVNNGAVFYTDSNGRRLMKRERKRDRMVAANFFPATSAARISDSSARMTVLMDRPQAVASIVDGSIEFMLHRQILNDDGKGMNEPLFERAFGRGLIVRGTHVLYLESASETDRHRIESNRIAFAPWMSLSRYDSLTKYKEHFPMEMKTLLKKELPESVNILTLEYRGPGKLLFRVEYLIEKSAKAQPIEISFTDLFSGIVLKGIDEMTLDGNLKKNCIKPLKWQHGVRINKTSTFETFNETLTKNFVIFPMQIRTFVLYVDVH